MDRVRSSQIAYVVIAWGVVVALLVQVSLVGLWLFSGQPTLAIHKEFGHAIFLGVFGLVIVAFTGRLTPRIKFVTALLSVITAVQTEVFALLPGSPLRAFHTVLPLVIFFLAASLAHAATSLVRIRLDRTTLALPTGESPANY
jgi:uncharacterized protein DUF6220